MRILLVSDQHAGSNESLIEGIFQGHLREIAEITVVYFSKELSHPIRQNSDLIIPHRYKRRGAAKVISELINLHSIDIVIVRNFFPVLSSFIKFRKIYQLRLGFWNTFPHSFRRYFQAQLEGKSLLRKRLEYFWHSIKELRLVQQCDFLVVMSNEFKKTFFPEITIPWMALPTGFKSSDLPVEPISTEDHKPRRFIYTGTVDSLRRTDLIVDTMSKIKEDFLLDIYTSSNNRTTTRIRQFGYPRIRILPPVMRRELYKRMIHYDFGIGIIPNNKLFRVSSPTKTIEYYAVGLPALLSHLPEYLTLFDDKSAVFCNFTPEDIQRAVQAIIAMPRKQIMELGKAGQCIVKERRDYMVLSRNLYAFLSEVCSGSSTFRQPNKAISEE